MKFGMKKEGDREPQRAFGFDSENPYMKGSTELNNVLSIIGEKPGTYHAFGVSLKGKGASFVRADWGFLLEKKKRGEKFDESEKRAYEMYCVLSEKILTEIGRESPMAQKLLIAAMGVLEREEIKQTTNIQSNPFMKAGEEESAAVKQARDHGAKEPE